MKVAEFVKSDFKEIEELVEGFSKKFPDRKVVSMSLQGSDPYRLFVFYEPCKPPAPKKPPLKKRKPRR